MTFPRLVRRSALLILLITPFCFADTHNAFSETSTAKNLALLVGVSHGLPGIDKDVKNAAAMVTNPAYAFETSQIMDEQGTSQHISESVTSVASEVLEGGTFLFYFSGHGDVGSIISQDDQIKVEDLRKSLEEARKNTVPLTRLVMIFDSCFSASLIDPLNGTSPQHMFDFKSTSEDMAASIFETMTSKTHDAIFRKLFVFASSRADETSQAGEDGSEFTVALRKSFDESITKNASVNEFIAAAQTYTVDHHPVAKLWPATWGTEKMK
jgi:hypothetical protein